MIKDRQPVLYREFEKVLEEVKNKKAHRIDKSNRLWSRL